MAGDKKNKPQTSTVEAKRLENQKPDDSLKASSVLKVSVGVMGNAAMLYGSTLSSLGKLSGLLDELNAAANLSPSLCRDAKPEPAVEDESLDPNSESCWNKFTLYKKSKEEGGAVKGEEALEQVKSLISLMEELTKPYSFGSKCVNPYFEQFFNAIPFQFLLSYYIRELLKKLAGALSETEMEELVREVEPCGAELTTILKQNSPDFKFPELFPLFKLPPIPLIPQVNLFAILKRLIMELTCVGICAALSPLIKKLTKLMLQLTDGLVEGDDPAQGTLSEFLDRSLEKIHLNNIIADFALEEAVRLHMAGGLIDAQKAAIGPPPLAATKNKLGLWKTPSKEEDKKAYAALLIVIRQYFTSIFNFSKKYKKQKLNTKKKIYEKVPATRDLGTKEIAYMMLGEYNCLTMADLLEIGKMPKYAKLKLDTEKRIIAFFKFLAKYVNLFKVIEDHQSKECPPDPCQVIDKEMKDEALGYLAELCKIINMSTSAPPIPVNNILGTLGMDNLFSEGIKAQFDHLKNDYLILLGFPSLQGYPETADLSTVLPKEHGLNTDYDVWNEVL